MCWTIPAEKAKNGNSHRIFLSSLAMELLNEIKSINDDSKWLFPAPYENKACFLAAQLSHAVSRRSHIQGCSQMVTTLIKAYCRNSHDSNGHITINCKQVIEP